jgi:glycosyltransferase involved in cell wall biosynthesis
LDNKKIVSIVVPTFNSAKILSACLASVHRQTYPFKEIIVVDNFSSDQTQQIAQKFNAKFLLAHGTQAAARNAGCSNALGEFVLFLDSDQQLDTLVIEECVAICNCGQVDAVKIPEIFIGLDFWGKCSAKWKNEVVTAEGTEGGIPRFFRKKVLLAVSAYKSQLKYWEDRELQQRLRKAGVKEEWSKCRVLHFENGTLNDITRKYLSYGRSIRAFKEVSTKAPYISTIKTTLLTSIGLLKNPKCSAKTFLGVVFLLALKSSCAAVGIFSSKNFSSLTTNKK